MHVTVERAIEGPKLLAEGLDFDEALELLDRIYTSYCSLRQMGFAKAACQVQIRSADNRVVYRAGPL